MLLLGLSLAAAPLHAASSSDPNLSEETLEALVSRANQAEPRYQCFLYAEIVHKMSELSLRQYSAGEVVKASHLLKQIQRLSRKIRLSVTRKDKRLRNAEIMLNRTSFRLTELLHSSDIQYRPLIKQTIAEVNEAQNATLTQVFSK
jgi:hypothetical protein